MPSPESSALREHFAQMAERVAANPTMDLPTLRDVTDALSTRQREPTDVTYEEVDAAGRPALWVRPAGANGEQVVLYTHGGGYISHSMSTSRKLVGHLAKAAGAAALIPDYRLAPEHPFPAQLDDATGAYHWLLDRGVAPEAVAIAGESAGGNLAAGTAVKLRDEGHALPGALVLFSPWFDLLGELETFDSNAESDAFLSRQMSQLMAQMFLGETAATEPLANPLHADLTGLPPVFVTAGSEETLLASVRRFATRAERAGVDVTLRVADGMQHAFQWMAGRAPEADASIAEAGRFLRGRLA